MLSFENALREALEDNDPQREIVVTVKLTACDVVVVSSIMDRGWADTPHEVIQQAIRGLNAHLRARERKEPLATNNDADVEPHD